jgi:hypothetical protein
VFAITALLSLHMGCTMSLKRHPQGATEGYYTFPSKNADKCLTGTKEYLQQVLDKLQSPNSSLRYVWYNSTVQQGYCPDRFMQHDKAGDLCFPDIEVWIDNDPTPILNTNHVRMGSLYKIRHHNFAFPNIKINHPVVMVECLNGTTIGGEAPVATSAVDADAKAVSLLATAQQDSKPLAAMAKTWKPNSLTILQQLKASLQSPSVRSLSNQTAHIFQICVQDMVRHATFAMAAAPDYREKPDPKYPNAFGNVPTWIQAIQQYTYGRIGSGSFVLNVWLGYLYVRNERLSPGSLHREILLRITPMAMPWDSIVDPEAGDELWTFVEPAMKAAQAEFGPESLARPAASTLSGLIATLMVAAWSLQ